MSGFGFSPSDIVNGTKALWKGFRALRKEGGFKETYEETSDGLALRSTALSSLDRLAVSTAPISLESSSDLRCTVQRLRLREERKVRNLEKYEKDLGSIASSGKSRAIPRKLKWAFGGE
ncbi:hypothetical protein GJ744_011077 [Endocarpon pusillum]|uniref:Uncharacterized protein n=1 Tax=Endocarpon pusillum TaxID=364733 RepID=A0A8H7AH34_9EURO|nr:hypothetical protein GJ744_011077 [Endocarpon pusillum]